MTRSTLSKKGLSAPRRNLLQLLQQINFGRLENLHISRGEPLMTCKLRIVREVKFGGDYGPRPEHESEDFLLKVQIVELFAYLDVLQDGLIEVLEVKHGLPFRLLQIDAAA